MSQWHTYAARMSKPPELEVTYFGLTRDGFHSFDVFGTPPGYERRLIGIIKRVPPSAGAKRRDGAKNYKAWRNGHQKKSKTLGGAVQWVVSCAAEGGEVLFPEETS